MTLNAKLLFFMMQLLKLYICSCFDKLKFDSFFCCIKVHRTKCALCTNMWPLWASHILICPHFTIWVYDIVWGEINLCTVSGWIVRSQMIGIVVQMRLLQYLLTLVVCHNELQARPLLYVVSWPLASSPLQNIFTKKTATRSRHKCDRSGNLLGGFGVGLQSPRFWDGDSGGLH